MTQEQMKQEQIIKDITYAIKNGWYEVVIKGSFGLFGRSNLIMGFNHRTKYVHVNVMPPQFIINAIINSNYSIKVGGDRCIPLQL